MVDKYEIFQVFLVESQKIRMEVAGAPQLQQRHSTTGLDEENRDAAIVNSCTGNTLEVMDEVVQF